MKQNQSIVRRKAVPQFAPKNRAGGDAFISDPKTALYKQVVTSMWSGDGYYEKQAEWLERFQTNVAQVVQIDPEFPFKLAAFARDRSKMGLRTSPIALYVEASILTRGLGLSRKYAPLVLQRADEPAEAIAYFKKYYEGNVPHGILRGIADTLPRWNEYQLAKYKGERNAVKMRDVFRLARPRPTLQGEAELWNRAVKNELAIPYTWETEISAAGKDPGAKQEAWNKLIYSGKLPIFALTRNIRNILEAHADLEAALSQVVKERVVGSGILPFQWYKAWKANLGVPSVAQVFEQALMWTLEDSPKLPGSTLVVCDNSSSMDSDYVSRGMSNAEIGNLLGAMSLYLCDDGHAGTFGDHFSFAPIKAGKNLMENKHIIDRTGDTTGHSTNAWRIFEHLTTHNRGFDRVILFSDMQCYVSNERSGGGLSQALDRYLVSFPECKLYSVDLASQDNTTQFHDKQPVVALAGWSDSILRFIAAAEAGQKTVYEIEAFE